MLFLLRPPATAFAPPQTVWFLSSTQRQACAGTEQIPGTIFHVLLDRSPKSHKSAEGLCKEQNLETLRRNCYAPIRCGSPCITYKTNCIRPKEPSDAPPQKPLSRS